MRCPVLCRRKSSKVAVETKKNVDDVGAISAGVCYGEPPELWKNRNKGVWTNTYLLSCFQPAGPLNVIVMASTLEKAIASTSCYMCIIEGPSGGKRRSGGTSKGSLR